MIVVGGEDATERVRSSAQLLPPGSGPDVLESFCLNLETAQLLYLTN